MTLEVAPLTAIPGLLSLVYDAGAGSASTFLTNLPTQPDRAEEVATADVVTITPFSGNVLARLFGGITIVQGGLHSFTVSGGGTNEVRLDGTVVSGPISLSAGVHELDVRVVVLATAQLPISVSWSPLGAPSEPLPGELLTHDLTTFAPVVNSIFPLTGDEGGGNAVAIDGLGFFESQDVVVNWGGTPLGGASLAVTPSRIDLIAPPGAGVVSVSVSTPRGTSKSFFYTYQEAGPLPVSFTTSTVATAGQASTGDWGPDGRLYVGSRSGELRIITFDDNYNVISVDIITTLRDQLGTNDEMLGLTFNPHDAPDPVKIYLSSGDLYSPGGYPGQVTVLTGPNFDTAVPLITGLPVSGIDHNVNGMQFDNNGDLYIDIGGNTNMGVPGGSMNNLPASPLSGAMVRARTSLPTFNGTITYVDSVTGLPSTDAFQGQNADVAPGVDVAVWGHGLRNPYDLVFTTWGLLYSTDNGPNTGFGPESTGATTEVSGNGHADELLLVEFGKYYGHANRNRGRTDPRQNIFRDNVEPSIPGVFTQQIAGFGSSTDGIVEYRATTFNNALRGDLIVQKYGGQTTRMVLSPDKRSVVQQVNLPFSFGALDVCAGPGGALFGMNYGGGSVSIAVPNDPSPGMRAFDIFPWRAPAIGGHPFIIGGQGFGTDLQSTSVTIGGLPATITSISDTRIRGIVPASPSPPLALQDVVVTANGETRIILQAFRYLLPPGNEPNN